MRRSLLIAARSLLALGAARRPRAPSAPAVGDGQRLRHGRAPERDRHPRLDARHAARRARCSCASGSSTATRRRALALTSQAPTPAGVKRRRGGRRVEAGWSFDVQAAARRTRSSARRRARSSGARRAASCGARGASPRPATARPPARDPAGSQRRDLRGSAAEPNSRGSLVMTPVTPSASSRRIRARVVDRPDVELAARLAGPPRTSARRDEPPVGHHRVAAARADVRRRERRQAPAHVRSSSA